MVTLCAAGLGRANGKLYFGCTKEVLERSLASLSCIEPPPWVQVGSGLDSIIIVYAAWA